MTLGFYLLVLDPSTAVAVVALMAVLARIQGLWLVRADIMKYPAQLLRFILPDLEGVTLGQLLLGAIHTRSLRLLIATLLVLYGRYFSFRVSGSGALPLIWLRLRLRSKSETRAVLQPDSMATQSATVIVVFARGAYGHHSSAGASDHCGLLAAQVGFASLDASATPDCPASWSVCVCRWGWASLQVT